MHRKCPLSKEARRLVKQVSALLRRGFEFSIPLWRHQCSSFHIVLSDVIFLDPFIVNADILLHTSAVGSLCWCGRKCCCCYLYLYLFVLRRCSWLVQWLFTQPGKLELSAILNHLKCCSETFERNEKRFIIGNTYPVILEIHRCKWGKQDNVVLCIIMPCFSVCLSVCLSVLRKQDLDS